MTPLEEPPADNISAIPRSASKRKLPPEHRKATAAKNTRTPSIPTDASTQSTLQFSKRQKTSHQSGPSEISENMLKGKGVAGTKVIDLTRPSPFQPNTGAKKLVIKNLRTSSRQDSGEFYQRTWNDIDGALTEIFSGKSLPSLPLEILCRGVETTCRHAEAEKLFFHYKARCKEYIEKKLAVQITKEAGNTDVQALRAVHRYWIVWNKQSVS